MVKTTVDIVQWYRVVYGVYCGYSKNRYSAKVLCCVWSLLCYSNSSYSVMVLCFVWSSLCYSNSRYSAMVPCCVWSLLWLQQQ